MAAIAYGKGLIAVEQYHGRISAEKFSSFVREHFASMFKKRAKPRRKLFLQDGDPSQNSVKARSAWDEIVTRSARVKTTLESIIIDVVERTILSMGKRINEITKRKGQRIKY